LERKLRAGKFKPEDKDTLKSTRVKLKVVEALLFSAVDLSMATDLVTSGQLILCAFKSLALLMNHL